MRRALGRRHLAIVLVLSTLVGCGVFTPKPLPPPAPVEVPLSSMETVPETSVVRVADAISAPSDASLRDTVRIAASAPARRAMTPVAPANVSVALETRGLALRARGRGMPAAEVGYYLDVFVARLRQVRIADVSVERKDLRITVELTGPTPFEAGTPVLTENARRTLAALAARLVDYEHFLVTVHNQTEATVAPQLDRRLTEQRSLAVALQFSAGGVAAERLLVVGHGGAAMPGGAEPTKEARVVLWLDPLRR